MSIKMQRNLSVRSTSGMPKHHKKVTHLKGAKKLKEPKELKKAEHLKYGKQE